MKVAFQKWYKTRSPILWLIGIFTLSKYAHCEIIFGMFACSADRKQGVRFLGTNYINMNEFDIVEVPVHDWRRAMMFCRKEKGKGYDWKGIFFNHLLGIRKDNPRKWYCSELVARALFFAGFPITTKCITPSKLHRILTTKKIEIKP